MAPKGSSRHPKTAAELMAELANDPSYSAMMAEKERFLEKGRKLNREAAAPLVAALRDAGFEIGSVSDLYQRKLRYERAIPILLEWLPKLVNDDVREDVVRALTVKWAKPSAQRPLLDELQRTSDESLRWAIANALSVVADDSVFEEVAAAATRDDFGREREMLTLALANMSRERAVPVLLELLEDDVVAGHAVMALGRLRASTAIDRLETFLNHERTWIRQEARKALERIHKAQSP